MKITHLHLVNFKRFTNLRIENIPETSKLVLLIGANGSGKSSVFDAFAFVDAAIKRDIGPTEDFWNYFKKKINEPVSVSIQFADQTTLIVSDDRFLAPNLPKTTFYGRTSFRQIPRLTRKVLGQSNINIEQDADRPIFFIDRDIRFENDVEKITATILKDFFRLGQSNEQIWQKYINPINNALENIFGSANGTKLQLIEIIPPLEGKVAQINFRKGDSEFHYNYLSAGEKEVVNLLINLLSRRSLYQDSVCFFDEIDLHLNTKIQFNLLKEITENWIPENSQLWVASHSLGFIEYAKQSENASIIDFDDLDFDLPQTLFPEPKDNPEIYEIAVSKEFLPALFQHMDIYFVENKDKDYYANVEIPKTLFVAENNRNSVYHKVRTNQYKGIVDRDFLTDDDIIQIKKHYPRLVVLRYYSIENYLYHPDNLEEYYQAQHKEFDKSQYIAQLTETKNQVKDTFIPTLMLKRTEYPYFSEPEYNGNSLQNRFKNKNENQEQSAEIARYLNSNDFETYYKVLPMKSYCTHLPQRQNIPKTELAKTSWFKGKIQKLLAEYSNNL
ncbi:MAG: AAA family ATPase [Raineya sp.]|nr:AAA family ATPase [Raineya sp.]MDW8295508.1 AAA family ATPase [Raineya sp.]